MVQIAERTSILDQEADKILLIERANHLWDRQATFEWDMVDHSSRNWSITSNADSIDAEGIGSLFNSWIWKDDVANDFSVPEPPSTLQQPPYAQELFAYRPDPLVNSPRKKCYQCNMTFEARSGISCVRCSRVSFACTPHMSKHAQAPPDIPALPMCLDNQDFFQKTAKDSLHSLMDETSHQDMQNSSCLGCGVTATWPGSSFCLTCGLTYYPLEDLSEAPDIISSAGGYNNPASEDTVPEESAPLCHRVKLSEVSSWKADKTTVDTELVNVKWVCPLYCDAPPPEFLLSPSHPGDDGDKANTTGTCARNRKNLLV